MTVKPDLALAASLFFYDAEKNALMPLEPITHEGRYFISFVLQDNHRDDPRNRVYFFNLVVKKKPALEVFVPESKAFVRNRPVP